MTVLDIHKKSLITDYYIDYFSFKDRPYCQFKSVYLDFVNAYEGISFCNSRHNVCYIKKDKSWQSFSKDTSDIRIEYLEEWRTL